MLYFIHQVALEQAVSSDIRNDRDVDYNQNDLFKRSLTWGVYRKTLVIGRDAEPWLLIGGGLRTMLLVGWDDLRWSGDLPAVISSRFSCSGISSIRVGLQVSWNLRPRRECQNIRPCCFTKTKCTLWILAENHWNKVWNTCECKGPHMGSPGQRWTPPCFLVFNTSKLNSVVCWRNITIANSYWGF